jgi:hypothetical protein
MAVYDEDEFDSLAEAIAHYRKLLKALQTRKQTLEIQAVKYGLAVPPHVATELEEARTTARQLSEKIKQLEGNTPPPNTPVTSSSPRIYPPLPITHPAHGWETAEPGVSEFAVLQMINNFERESPGTFVSDTQLADALKMDLQLVRDTMDILQLKGRTTAANTFGGKSAMLTATGRSALRAQ